MNPLSTSPNRWRPITVFNLLVGLLFSLSVLGQPAFLTNGLVAYYPFNGNANDESGYKNHGVPTSVTATENRFGNGNAAYRFKESEIYVPYNPVFNSPAITASAWIKTTRGGGSQVIVNRFQFGYSNPRGEVWWWGINDNDLKQVSGLPGLSPNLVGFGSPFPTNEWVMASFSYDGKTMRIYKNGVLDSSKDIGLNLNQGGNSGLSIGVSDQANGRFSFFDGFIDDVRIYTRALSDAEIQSLYAYESTPPDNSFITNGLVAYYPFNGNANDESGNGNHGTAINSSFVQDRNGSSASAIRFQNDITKFVSADSVSYVRTPKTLLSKSYRQGTISVWILPDNGVGGILCKAAPTADSSPVFTYGGYSQNTGWSTLGEPGTVYFHPKNGGGLMSSNSKIKIGSWNHIVLSYSEFGSSIYINGKLDSISNGQNYSLNPTDAPDGYNAIGGYLWDNDGSRGNPNLYSNGVFDNFRIYNRTLADTEVKALYDYESSPPQNNLNPRVASATAQVVNGFVVGATITDGGYGYVSNPVVTITGGGGTGAKATATQFNGVVTSITITNPGIGYTSAPSITIAPPPFPPRKATGTAQIVNGFVVGTKITDGGFGYDAPPAVIIVGGGGSGATAVATVANGVVTAITITNPGTGYTSAPLVRIASPPFAPKLGIETSKVYVRMSVVLGRKYQLEASTDLNTWTITGPAFIAQDEELVQEFDVNQVGRYFRINQVP